MDRAKPEGLIEMKLPIKTKRLYITEFTEGMAESVHLNSLDEDNRRFIPDEVFETIREARETINALMSFYPLENRPLVYPIFLHDRRQIGHVQAFPIKDGWEIGYHIAKTYTGKGYATEAVNAFLPPLMERLGICNIYGVCHADNIASRKVLEKCGFLLKYEGAGILHGKEQPICQYEKMLSGANENGLLQSIDKLHTTSMGAERIKSNLNLQTNDIVTWCKDAVKQADIIIGQGKNWYVYKDGMAITINAHSYTIITAHKINAKVRVMRKSDYECLNEFLYQAIFIPQGEEFPPRSIINTPEIFVYIKDFGTKSGDLGVVAEQNRQVIGAAWTRIIPAYGHIDDDTPELAISILPEFRGYGIGTKLMKKLFVVLRENGYKQTSLSVQKDNPAVRFYQRLGYQMTGERLDHAGHEDYLMIKDLFAMSNGITSEKVLNLYNWFKENGIIIWICGGWCVDALLGKQTRKHEDLDIAVHRKDNARLRQLLEDNDYKEEKRDDSSEFMYVMQNTAGESVDVHAFEYDKSGKNTYGVEFPFGSLTGKGRINGQEVKCVSPEWMFKFITSYEPREKDLRDMRALGEKFGFVLSDV